MRHRLVGCLLLIGSALPALAGAADEKRAVPDPLGTGGILQMVVALVAVLAFIGLLTWVMRRLGPCRAAWAVA